MYEVSENSNL